MIQTLTGFEYRSVKVTKEIPLEAACVTFDVVNELRSTLDYAVYESVRVLDKIDDPENTKFPFGDNFKEAENTFYRDGKGVPACIRDFLLNFGPYSTDGGNHILWAFNKLRNSKIHRSLAPMIIANQAIGIGGSGYVGEIQIFSEWNPEKRELIYAKTRNVDETIDINVSVDIVFDKPAPLARQPVIGTLRNIFDIVSSVVTGLESETARILSIRQN